MKIAITIKLGEGITFQSNGMLQNLLFLANAFNSIRGWDCYFLCLGDNKTNFSIDQKKCIHLNDYIENASFKFDLIILGGFSSTIFEGGVFANSKIVVFHCGATMVDDIRKCLNQTNHSGDKKSPPLPKVDEIWTLPHHANNLGYLSALYNNRNSKVMPYVLDSTFIDAQLHENNYINLEHFQGEYLSHALSSIHIYEPNNTFCKTCLIPLAIVVEHKRHGMKPLSCCRTFCAEAIAKNQYFNEKCRELSVTSDKQYYEFHNRVPFVYSLKAFGTSSIILSHQLSCDLNNLYFDALYLGLPLVHNSNTLSNFGYFYPDSDINVAITQIDHIIDSHASRYPEYCDANKEIFWNFHPMNPSNLNTYIEAIETLVLSA